MSGIQFNQAGGHHAPAIVVSLLLISVTVVAAANAENRAASPTTPTASRNPPFNGSIFGKRSVLPALQGAEGGSSDGGPIEMSAVLGAAVALGALDLQPPATPLELLIQQQVALTRASISQCLAQQQPRQQPQSAMTSSYCAELLGIQMQDSKERENVAARAGWFNQLLA